MSLLSRVEVSRDFLPTPESGVADGVIPTPRETGQDGRSTDVESSREDSSSLFESKRVL